MRIITFILAWIILLAAVTPCEDSQATAITHTQSLIKAPSGHHDADTADLCGPLCICSCCSATTVYYSSPQLPLPVTANNASYGAMIPPHPTDIAMPVWQPPQLS